MAAPKRPNGNAGKGRPLGAKNKATRGLQELAQEYTAEALKTLSKIMRDGQSEPARVAAANSLLDRGYGKPAQTTKIEGTVTVNDERAETDAQLRDTFGPAAGIADEPAGGGKVVH